MFFLSGFGWFQLKTTNHHLFPLEVNSFSQVVGSPTQYHFHCSCNIKSFCLKSFSPRSYIKILFFSIFSLLLEPLLFKAIFSIFVFLPFSLQGFPCWQSMFSPPKILSIIKSPLSMWLKIHNQSEIFWWIYSLFLYLSLLEGKCIVLWWCFCWFNCAPSDSV